MLEGAINKAGIRRFLLTLSSDYLTKIVAFSALLLYSKSLSAENYNYLLLIISSTVVAVSVLSMGVVSASFRLLAGETSKHKIDQRMVAAAIFSVLCTTFLYWSFQAFLNQLELGDYAVFREVSWAWYWVILGETLSVIAKSMAYVRGKPVRVAAANFFAVLVFGVSLAYLFLLGNELTSAAYLNCVAITSIFRASFLVLSLKVRWAADVTAIPELINLRFSVAFMFHILGVWCLQHISSWIVFPVMDGAVMTSLLWANLILSALLLIPEAMFKSSLGNIKHFFGEDKLSLSVFSVFFFRSFSLSFFLMVLVVLVINLIYEYGLSSISFELGYVLYMASYLFLHTLYFLFQKMLMGEGRSGVLIFGTYVSVAFLLVVFWVYDIYSIVLVMTSVLLAKTMQLFIMFFLWKRASKQHIVTLT
ncbi:hypothetical protein [Oceanicoccus sagamiensis]|uniref:Uncharacterized protein n=1 Tax=Oceanicoccus sagamiensis TaxID=716816 RepID=A0A1X9N5L8_9GAMM|nr:hypothetical protein [Oceanicoccus sagamiensis]ARN73026.1 hypothetical protein BST96_02230 [Oceanicoccus sagamiensis]